MIDSFRAFEGGILFGVVFFVHCLLIEILVYWNKNKESSILKNNKLFVQNVEENCCNCLCLLNR